LVLKGLIAHTMKTERAITIHFKDLHVRYQKSKRKKGGKIAIKWKGGKISIDRKEDRDKIERRKDHNKIDFEH